MIDTAFILQSCTRSIVDAEEAVHLLEQKSRLEQAVLSNDPALTLDTAKSLLESIIITILTDKVSDLEIKKDFNGLYADMRSVLPLNSDKDAAEILKKLTNQIVNSVAALRNKYGAASHGNDGYFQSPIEMPEAEMVAHIVDGMGGFLLRRHKNTNTPEYSQRIFYSDYGEFNDWLDSQNSPIDIPVEEAKKIPFSIFLFTYDVDTYRAMLLQYLQTEEEDAAVVVDDIVVESVVEPEPEPEPELPPKIEINPNLDVAKALMFNDEVRQSITDEQCLELARFVSEYATNKAGLDWQNRDSLIAKFRIKLKRQLIRVTYPEAFIDHAIDLLIEKAVQYYPSEY